MTSSIQKRDYGIDLLRLLAMGLIILHHLLGHGGLANAFPTFSTSGMVMYLLSAVTRCAVNTYALISGYVMVRSRFRPSRLISLWLQVAFYGILGVLCLPLMGGSIRPIYLFSAVTPISHDYYWYFTCYAVVFCLSPFLNLLMNSLSKRQTGLLLATLAVLFSMMPAVIMTDRFQLNGGYHAGWLIILYLFGGAMRLHEFHRSLKPKAALVLFTGCILLSWAFRLAILALGVKWPEETLLSYTSPTMLACGVALLSLFAGRRLPAWLTKTVAHLSPLAFGVYLIHDHPIVREYLIRMRLTGLANLNPAMMLSGLFACWAGIYALCLMIEWLRGKLFAMLRVSSLCGRMESRLFQWADRLFPKADA